MIHFFISYTADVQKKRFIKNMHWHKQGALDDAVIKLTRGCVTV